ncbi:MAG: cold shock domain-containing protein [Thermoplasmatota archaeon]
MNHKVRDLLQPDTGICPGCADGLLDEMRCGGCDRQLYGYDGQVYECPVCGDFFCRDCWLAMEGRQRHRGTVKKWFGDRGYGFLNVKKLDEDVFLHRDDVAFTPREGQRLSFEVAETEKGPRARNVKRENGV